MQRIEALSATPSPAPASGFQQHMRVLRIIVVAGVLLGALLVGSLGKPQLLGAAIAVAAAVPVLLANPAAAIVALPWLAIYLPLQIKASTAVTINISVVIVPILLILWLFRMAYKRQMSIVHSPLYLPIMGFILAANLSWVLGNVYWDPSVPRPENILLVQIGQWGVFAFSMLAMVVGLNLLNTPGSLRAAIFSYLAAGATAVILYSIPLTAPLAAQLVQLGSVDSLFWVWMNSLLLSLLLFRGRLRPPMTIAVAILWLLLWRLAVGNSEWMSGMVPMAVSTLVLLALRLRKGLLYLLPALVLVAFFAFPSVREALKLDRELEVSGGGRLNHIRIVMMFAVQKPWFGLGPAAYRHYTFTVPNIVKNLLYAGAPVSSHNNYIDLFAQMGVVGVATFAWVATTIGRALIGAVESHKSGFEAVFANAAAAAFAGMLASGMLGDWFLPFVYNIGLNGMRTSITSWILFGAAAGLAVRAFGRHWKVAQTRVQSRDPRDNSRDEQA